MRAAAARFDSKKRGAEIDDHRYIVQFNTEARENTTDVNRCRKAPSEFSPIIQMRSVDVAGGIFDTYQYIVNNGSSKGADIALFFQAKDGLGNDGDTISLVQTVTDTTKLSDSQTGRDITPKPTTSQLGNRVLSSSEDYAEKQDAGTGIDQEVLDAKGEVVNVDPRYTEERMSEAVDFNIKGRSRHPYTVKSAEKKNGHWSKAQLNDAPAVSTRINRIQHELTGGMKFEVAALHNQTGQYLGSIRWGWHMSGDNAELDPIEIEMVDSGGASKTFHRAAKKWNETDIVGQGGPYKPMQLPVDKKKLGGSE